MNPIQLLLLVLLLIYLLEGLFWVRRQAFGFQLSSSQKARLLRPDSPLGNAAASLVPQSSLPPLAPLLVVEAWPITIGSEGVLDQPLEVFQGKSRPQGGGNYLAFSEIKNARAEGKKIFINGKKFSLASSAKQAELLVDLLEQLTKAKPKARKEILKKAREESFSTKEISSRLQLLSAQGRSLAWFCNLQLFCLIVFTPSFFYLPQVAAYWREILVALLVLQLAIDFSFFRSFGKLFPGRKKERWFRFALIFLSPPAAVRARAFLARDLLAGFHPMAVAKVLLSQEKYRSFFAEAYRDLGFPMGPEPETEGAQKLLQQQRESLQRQCRKLSENVQQEEALAAPEPEEELSKAYCPRCHTQYRKEEGTCEDCQDVHLVLFKA